MLYRDRGVSVTSDGSTMVLQRKSTEDGQLVRTTGSERAVDVVRTYTQSAVELGLWRNSGHAAGIMLPMTRKGSGDRPTIYSATRRNKDDLNLHIL
jgi:hypothetical protein